jgi:hypothetical protein
MIMALAWHSGYCQDQNHSDPVKFFLSHETVKAKITADFQQVLKNKSDEETEHPATMEFLFPNGDNHKVDLTIRPRGISRRQICNFPPLLLNFPKKEMKGPLEGLNKVKLVTHCRGVKKYSDYIMKEYLAYRIYNELTDYSLRVRLLEIDYVNTGKKDEVEREYGFLIEDIDDLADRLGFIEFNAESFGLHRLNQERVAMMNLFQYMIGNLDWSASKMHNCKLIVSEYPNGQQNAVAIPYDFDYSGFVDTEYALPPTHLGLNNVQQRLYRGLCRDANYFIKLIPHYLDKRERTISLIENADMSDSGKKKAINYLNNFYEIIENPKKIERTIMTECR